MCRISVLAIIFFLYQLSFVSAQSVSSFSSAFFNKNGVQAPIKVGKGFHINDINKQTRSCFTVESSNSVNLRRVSGNGDSKRTLLKVYYLRNDEDYQRFTSQDVNGQMSYLNFFSAGGEVNVNTNYDRHVTSERLVFEVIIDFGLFEYPDLIMTPDAQQIIRENRLTDFVNMYGTHYVSGVQKGSKARIILTRQIENEGSEMEIEESFELGAKLFKVGATFEVMDNEKINSFIQSSSFEVSVEVEGPSVNLSAIQSSASSLLESSNGGDMRMNLFDILGSIEGLNDENQAWFTRYYFSPWELYGLNGVNWDALKEEKLSRINNEVIDLITAKGLIEKYCSDDYIQEFGMYFYKQENRSKLIEKHSEFKGEVLPLLDTISRRLRSLNQSYKSCSNVYCVVNEECCKTTLNTHSIVDLVDKYLALFVQETQGIAFDDFNQYYEETTPDCEKNGWCDIVVKNYSYNPYSLYVDDEYVTTIDGKETITFEKTVVGVYTIKAVQNSGYLLYPTQNIRVVEATDSCMEHTITVGYED